MMHSNGLFDYDFGPYRNHAEPEYQFDLTEAFVDLAMPFGNGAGLSAADGDYPRALRCACEALTGGGITTDGVPLEIRVNGRRVAGCDCRPREIDARTGSAAASSCFR